MFMQFTVPGLILRLMDQVYNSRTQGSESGGCHAQGPSPECVQGKEVREEAQGQTPSMHSTHGTLVQFLVTKLSS